MSIGRPFLLSAFMLALCAGFAAPAWAQSEIEVNTTVLRDAPPPAPPRSPLKPVVLKPPPGMMNDEPQMPEKMAAQPAPPVSRAPLPEAAQPSPSPSGLMTAPDGDAAAPSMQSATVTPYIPVRHRPQYVPPPRPGGVPEDQAVQFPVVTKVRSDSPDPSLPASPSAPVPLPPAAAKDQDVVPVNPDVIAAVAKQLATSDGNKADVPAVPPARPADLKKKVRIEATKMGQAKVTRVVAAPLDAPPLPSSETPSGAGVPTLVEGASALPPPRVTNDHVMNKMMTMDKKRVMAGIEDAVKRTSNIPGRHVPDGNGAPLPVPGGGGTASFGAGRLMRQTTRGNTVIAPAPPASKTARDNDLSIPWKPDDKPEDVTASVTQQPSGPPSGPSSGPMTITYDKAQLGLDAALQGDINGRILPLMKSDPAARLQIRAFASDGSPDNHNARQRSLARALAVREYLIRQGVSQDRLDIHAMGMQTDRDPLDRVDFIPGSAAADQKL